MKRLYKYLIGIGLAGTLAACTLDEYNPGGTTSEVVFSTENGINALVNSAYVYFGSQFYGREDILMLTEGGTDLWINIANTGYGRQMTKYEELVATTGQIRNTWNRFYEIVNYCNAGLERIADVSFTNEEEKNARIGELSFLRAYAYWHLVEQYGDIDLRTEETKTVVLTAQRSPATAFYDLMLSDLDVAIANLPVQPIPATDQGRATKKAAYGLKARVALTRVAYESSTSEKDRYYKMASDAAQYVINNQAELQVSLYDTPEEVFRPANNKNNKEAMFFITHSTINSLNPQPNNPNRLHIWFKAKYSEKAGMVRDLYYGADRNSQSSMCFMPTRHLLELYDEEVDRRYSDWFREEYYLNVNSYTWTEDDLAAFQKPASMAGTTLNRGDLALLFTKKKITEEKRDLPYALVDIDDTYNGERVSTNARFNVHFPALMKYDDPDLPEAGSQVGSKDVIVMRLAEMYLIAAEAETMMGGGNKTLAKDLMNVLRERAALPGKESDMLITESDLDIDFILEERGRELCGEHIRWFDLKRTGKLYSYVQAYNKDITTMQPYHVNRPIPQQFLDVITNPQEFGQNDGY
ncbi:RagB/SusD family nutrient uptake outer membrane protein [Sphingobacterium corticibacterium]|uniref:RagB/SusD family nutrient uptake outer membrane protein n=1 Tax=Sphingobacterium corticibacterium TaxID=2484746 RepID=A0A4Q6XU36_9SPHI|nr:RagB/SusD family nutrient uptake outer membrane protein [Sphingobacterium corticibacterium]RZF59856.1 RagB/SusD family nutrient uptake outer membrane protein [Sphingobacterium corticibacterium]